VSVRGRASTPRALAREDRARLVDVGRCEPRWRGRALEQRAEQAVVALRERAAELAIDARRRGR
jgi:hypothetical protein